MGECHTSALHCFDSKCPEASARRSRRRQPVIIILNDDDEMTQGSQSRGRPRLVLTTCLYTRKRKIAILFMLHDDYLDDYFRDIII